MGENTAAFEITGLDDERISCFFRLTESELANQRNAEHGLFIAEGEKVIGHAIEAGIEPVSFLTDKRHLEKALKLAEKCPGSIVYTGESALLDEITGFRMNRGFLAAMKRPPEKKVSALIASGGRLCVLEDLRDPANVGAVMRSASALGMDGVLISPSCTDPLHRRAVKSSMGCVFSVPWARCTDIRETTEELKKNGYLCVALALDKNSVSITDTRLKEAERLALYVGTEGDGLKRETVALCDFSAIIPMHNGADSLNAAAAAAVAFWETGKKL